MRIQTPPPQQNLVRKNFNNGDPEQPNYFKQRFTTSMEHSTHATTDILVPFSSMLVCSRAGQMVGGFAGQGGAMLGGFAGSILGWRLGDTMKPKVHNLVDKLGSGSEGRHAFVSTAAAGALGGVTIALAVGRLSPAAFGIGAGITTAGLAGWGLWKASR